MVSTTKKKLVRDLIPTIAGSNEHYKFYTAAPEEYYFLLKSKLLEEIGEFLSDNSIDELADVLEVIEALYIYMGYTHEHFNKIKNEKRAKRGGFNQRIVLLQTNAK